MRENLDLYQLKEIYDYQKDNPPLHQLVAVYLGVGSASNSSQNLEQNDDEDIVTFLNKNDVKEAPYNGPRMMET